MKKENINTLNEALFTIKERGPDDVGPELVDPLPVGVAVFRPSSYFSILELCENQNCYTGTLRIIILARNIQNVCTNNIHNFT